MSRLLVLRRLKSFRQGRRSGAEEGGSHGGIGRDRGSEVVRLRSELLEEAQHSAIRRAFSTPRGGCARVIVKCQLELLVEYAAFRVDLSMAVAAPILIGALAKAAGP